MVFGYNLFFLKFSCLYLTIESTEQTQRAAEVVGGFLLAVSATWVPIF
jgi:hypothetical protein